MSKLSNSWARCLLAAALLAGTGIFLRSRGQAEDLPPRLALASFPLQIGGWVGREVGISPDVREVLGDGDFLFRLYQFSPGEPSVSLFIAYFPTQRTGSTIHSPQNCLPGAGWTPLENSRFMLSRPEGGTIKVNRYVIAKGLERQLVYYWYQAHGRVVASEYWAKFYLVADGIRLNRSDGALVRVVTAIGPENDEVSAQRRAVEFAGRIIPLLARYIPE